MIRSIFFSSSNEFLLAYGSLEGKVNGTISSLIPNLLKFFVGIIIFNGHLGCGVQAAIFFDIANHIIFINVSDFVLSLSDNWNLDIGGCGSSVFVLLSSEDVNSDDGGLG